MSLNVRSSGAKLVLYNFWLDIRQYWLPSDDQITLILSYQSLHGYKDERYYNKVAL